MLIGTWDVTASVSNQAGGPAQEVPGISVSFGEDGKGSFTIADTINFTYQYIKESNTIQLHGDLEGVLHIDTLTKDSFVFHSSEDAKYSGFIFKYNWTFYGTKTK